MRASNGRGVCRRAARGSWCNRGFGRCGSAHPRKVKINAPAARTPPPTMASYAAHAGARRVDWSRFDGSAGLLLTGAACAGVSIGMDDCSASLAPTSSARRPAPKCHARSVRAAGGRVLPAVEESRRHGCIACSYRCRQAFRRLRQIQQSLVQRTESVERRQARDGSVAIPRGSRSDRHARRVERLPLEREPVAFVASSGTSPYAVGSRLPIGGAAGRPSSSGRKSMTSSHTCPQYSQLNAVTAIARVQPVHRFQVISGAVRQAPYHGRERAFSGLFCAHPSGRRPAPPQN